jgi:hypothetical protein
MQDNLQPIVVIRQQLICALHPDTMQPVVVRTKEQCREKFSECLNQALEKVLGVATKGRPEFVRKRYHVTYEGARKWLTGKSIPDMAHIAMICTDLKVHPTWLLTGEGEMMIGAAVAAETPVATAAARAKVIPLPQQREWPFPSIDPRRIDALSRDDRIRLDDRVSKELAALEDAANIGRSTQRG